MAALHGVLVTYRRPDQLAHAIEVLFSQTRMLDSLVVVDNDPAGSARSVMASKEPYPIPVDYLLTGANLGAAGGNSFGMGRVLQYAADDHWIVTLDDDDPPRTPDMLEELFSFALKTRAGYDRTGGVGLSGGVFDPRSGRFRRPPDNELTGPIPTSWIGGNQLPMYAVAAVRAVGLFDDRYFINFEDLDYGLRMADAGFALYAHGDLWRREREHWGRLAIRPSPSRDLGEVSWRRYYSLRNLVYLLRTRGHAVGAMRVAASHLGKPLYNAPRQPRAAWSHLTLNARAIYDGYAGRMGLTVEPQPKASPKQASP